MNENTLKRIHNHYANNPRDQRATFTQVIEKELSTKQTEQERNEFLLRVLPFIKQYSTEKHEEEVTGDVPQDLNMVISKIGVVQKGKVYRDFMKECLSVIIEDDANNCNDEMNLTKCPECRELKMAYIMNESVMSCMNCGHSFFYQDFSLPHYSNHTMNNGEFICQFAYKRINHFREWLTQIQGKENTFIPPSLIIQIMKELKKERIQNVDEITSEKIKKYLKKNGLSKYYEHIPIIINKICHKYKITISIDIEQLLVEKFGEIQAPFERHRPKGRKNFLSYSYTLHKLCQLIGRIDLAKMFPLLKSRTKLYIQDEIWEKICGDLNWKFIPSL